MALKSVWTYATVAVGVYVMYGFYRTSHALAAVEEEAMRLYFDPQSKKWRITANVVDAQTGLVEQKTAMVAGVADVRPSPEQIRRALTGQKV